MGIFSFIHKHAVASYQEDIKALIELYRPLEKRQLADYFVYSTWTRAGLQNEGHFKLPDGQPSLSSDASYFMFPHLENAVKTLRKRGSKTEAAALSIWMHSARGVVNQETGEDLKQLWALIMETRDYWDEYLEKLYEDDKKSGMDQDLANRTLVLSREILANVPPEQFR